MLIIVIVVFAIIGSNCLILESVGLYVCMLLGDGEIGHLVTCVTFVCL